MTPALVDTSVWIDHFRHDNQRLGELLSDGTAWCHQFVVGELACGNLRDRATTLDLLAALPTTANATHGEARTLLERHELVGTGLGWVDIHLLTSARLSHVKLWTLEGTLHRAAELVGVAVV